MYHGLKNNPVVLSFILVLLQIVQFSFWKLKISRIIKGAEGQTVRLCAESIFHIVFNFLSLLHFNLFFYFFAHRLSLIPSVFLHSSTVILLFVSF